MVGVLRSRPGLLKERYKGLVQKGQPWIDRVIVLTFVASYMGSLVFIPLDVFQYRLLPSRTCGFHRLDSCWSWWVWVIISLVFRENAFAAPVVRHQAERETQGGRYRGLLDRSCGIRCTWGIFIMNVGIALWLESYAGAILAMVPICLLALRIVF